MTPLGGAALRLVPAPCADPPYDDDPPARSWAVAPTQGALALTWVLPSGVDAVPGAGPATEPCASTLPDARAWTTRLSQACVEVLGGTRPVAQLRRWTSDEVYAQLRRAAGRGSMRVNDPRRRPERAPRVVVRTVRLCEVTELVVEACAVVDDGTRARAIALRLDGSGGRWRCTRFARL